MPSGVSLHTHACHHSLRNRFKTLIDTGLIDSVSVSNTCSFDWYSLCTSPDLTIDIVIDNPDLNWCWDAISRHPMVTPQIIKQYMNMPWDYCEICTNPNFSIEELITIIKSRRRNDEIFHNYYEYLSRNRNLTWRYVKDQWQEHWDYASLSINPGITLHDISDNSDIPWDWPSIALHRLDLTKDFIDENVQRPRFFRNLCMNAELDISMIDTTNISEVDLYHLIINNKTVTIEFIEKNLEEDSELWRYVTSRVTWKYIIANPCRQWDYAYAHTYLVTCDDIFVDETRTHTNPALWNWYCISYNQNVPWSVLLSHSHETWCPNALSLRAPLIYILKHPDMNWNDVIIASTRSDLTVAFVRHHFDLYHRKFNYQNIWKHLSKNKSFSIEDVVNNPDLPWDWDGLSVNLRISFDDMIRHPTFPWKIYSLGWKMTRGDISDTGCQLAYRQWHSACIIQRAWRKCINDPSYSACRKRLMREFEEVAFAP